MREFEACFRRIRRRVPSLDAPVMRLMAIRGADPFLIAVGTVGATLDFLGSESTTALVERLHREDLPGTIRRAGAGACVVLAPGAGPTTIPLG